MLLIGAIDDSGMEVRSMKNRVRKLAGRAKGALYKLSVAFAWIMSSEEKEFWRIYPMINSIEGFLVSPMQERWLFRAAKSLPDGANIVEIGSFKGRSTCSLAYGCEGTKKHVFAIDTFMGNDVDFHQRGFFNDFQHNIEKRGLTDYVTAIQGWSSEVAKTWNKPIHLLFIDGSHIYEDVLADFDNFYPHVVSGGVIAMHDVSGGHYGVTEVWEERKYLLRNRGTCATMAFGTKP